MICVRSCECFSFLIRGTVSKAIRAIDINQDDIYSPMEIYAGVLNIYAYLAMNITPPDYDWVERNIGHDDFIDPKRLEHILIRHLLSKFLWRLIPQIIIIQFGIPWLVFSFAMSTFKKYKYSAFYIAAFITSMQTVIEFFMIECLHPCIN